MNKKRFAEAMGLVDDRYYEEAANYRRRRKKPVWAKGGMLAACLALLVSVGAAILLGRHLAAPQMDLTVYFLSGSGAIKSKSVTTEKDSGEIFKEWAAANDISDVTLVDCVYDMQGTGKEQAEKEAGSTLLLTVSREFSRYASGEGGVFLIETLRRTFYENNRFDHMDLVIESLTDQEISHGIVDPDMQTDDGRTFVWEGGSEREIDGTECYSFELRFSDGEQKNSEMTGRLRGIYAVSNDGTKFYQYNMADDTWEQIRFPAGNDKETEYNQDILRIDTFTLRLNLPDGWSILPKEDEEYELMSCFSIHYFYNEKGEYAGKIGYNVMPSGLDGDSFIPAAIYNQIALGNDYRFDVREEYEVVKSSAESETALTEVYYSASVTDDHSEKINKGIVMYDLGQNVYIAVEFEDGALSDEQYRGIADSLSIDTGSGPQETAQ